MKNEFPSIVTISTEDLNHILCALNNAVIFQTEQVEKDFFSLNARFGNSFPCSRFKDSPRNFALLNRLDSIFCNSVGNQ